MKRFMKGSNITSLSRHIHPESNCSFIPLKETSVGDAMIAF
jgi:hypothetical protein